MRSVVRLHSLTAQCEASSRGRARLPGNSSRADMWPYSNFIPRCDLNAIAPCCEHSPEGGFGSGVPIKNYLKWPCKFYVLRGKLRDIRIAGYAA